MTLEEQRIKQAETIFNWELLLDSYEGYSIISPEGYVATLKRDGTIEDVDNKLPPLK